VHTELRPWRRVCVCGRQVPPDWSVRFFVHVKHRRVVLDEADGRVQPPRASCAYRSRGTQAWVRDRMLPVSFEPEWGSVELVRAALELVSTALGDASVQWLLLASESCVPVVPLPKVSVLRRTTCVRRRWRHDAGRGCRRLMPS
jgi:hypothetical protein